MADPKREVLLVAARIGAPLALAACGWERRVKGSNSANFRNVYPSTPRSRLTQGAAGTVR